MTDLKLLRTNIEKMHAKIIVHPRVNSIFLIPISCYGDDKICFFSGNMYIAICHF